jgi:hypothetical protein
VLFVLDIPRFEAAARATMQASLARDLPENAAVAARTLSVLSGSGGSQEPAQRPSNHHEALLHRRGNAGGHLRGGVPVMGPMALPPLLAGAASTLVPHHLIDDPGRDASVLEPGRERVAKVVGTAQIHGVQQRVAGRGQRPPGLPLRWPGGRREGVRAGCVSPRLARCQPTGAATMSAGDKSTSTCLPGISNLDGQD